MLFLSIVDLVYKKEKSADKDTGSRLQRVLLQRADFFAYKIIVSNVKKFGYNEHSLIISSFICIFLLVVSGTQCLYS